MNKLTEIIKITTRETKIASAAEKTMEIKDTILKKEYKIQNLMNALNCRDLNPYEEFYISGFLSRSACIEIPDTYHEEKRVFKKIDHYLDFNNKVHRDMIMEITQNHLPAFYPDQIENQCIAFLYMDDTNRFLAQKDSRHKLHIDSLQCYIPVIMNKKDYFHNVDNYVKMKCLCIPMNDELIDGLDEKAENLGLYSFFYDIYQPYITCFALESIDCQLLSKQNSTDSTIYSEQFCVEYEFTRNMSNSNLKDYVNKFLYDEEYHNFPTVFDIGNITLFLTKNDLSINVCDKKIGFYNAMNINNSEEYKNQIHSLQNTIKTFFHLVRKPHELSFITDERRIKIFDI